MAEFKKYLAVIIIFLFIGANILAPFSVLAQTVTPTDTPIVTDTPTDTPSITPTPTIDPNTTPTDAPTDTPTPTPTTDISLSSGGTTTDNTNSNSNSGSNTINPSPTDIPAPTIDPNATLTDTPTDTPTPTPDGSNASYSSNNSSQNSSSGNSNISTGNATSVTTGENDANTTSVNSQTLNQTINIFVDQQGNIDLSTPFNVAYSIIAHDKNTSPTVNVALTSISDYTYLSNNIVSTANTGVNTINGGKDALIKTGDAYSVVSFLNKTNFTIVDSTIHVVTINIFGNLNGNIILPDLSSTSGCTSCGVSVDIHNAATVINNVNSNAVSGQNTITTNGNAQINTGDTHSVINVLNMVNTDTVGVTFQQLFISIFGQWNGNFLGWGNLSPAAGGNSLGLTSITGNSGSGSDCGCSANLETTSVAVVQNNILSSANSGNNTIYGGGGANIQTGNAFSAVSLINLINSNFFRTTGFFGFINVFGNWIGDIGEASQFVSTQVTGSSDNSNTADQQTTTDQGSAKESGGQLLVTNTNNVGAYVHPGDTVTFFINVTNPGTGKVYGATLNLDLIHNGIDMGGAVYNLGDIPAGKTLHLKTGLVLSGEAPNGSFIAQAIANGTTGENDLAVSASAASNFIVAGGGQEAILGAGTAQPQTPTTPLTVSVKGASTTKANNINDNIAVFLSLFFLSAFLIIRGIRRRKYIKALFVKSAPFYTRLSLLRSFLL